MKSHAGFAIYIANFPVVLSSKLQGDGRCNFNKECMALNMAMKLVLPPWNILKVIRKWSQDVKTTADNMQDHCIWEDNNGALNNFVSFILIACTQNKREQHYNPEN